ncbi:MAG: hypothetical protein EOR30_29965 [Mesorhizobium sp.]|uniref:IS66 family transposase n=1 Tax=unclassified Mesorhizobium TaxID=325217 RepID=UPI000FE42622|nr:MULTISPECIES: transposase [unclassified Mesorhizobium]RWI34116.1 MAG: hypothetical protein EOR14_31580 [Mesorhizobium sp.]RWI63179.1 MAG: hypothetical protein EOR17_29640 [Mesorhizobium sp.]RWI82506.1 MAG: hypothetical protein EOR20_26765 [Mesorhizobium sp.]RWJ43937.1 MAG: hypothetical protein EOR30_29965 [Mesorhizobium sp.]RWJ57445.1 MAG: hypothetical protein EOR32_29895 [Mesorhizobium sp.]
MLRALRPRRCAPTTPPWSPTSSVCATASQPLHELIEVHVLAAERLHGDDPTVPILAKARPSRATSGPMSRRPAIEDRAPPGALYYASCDRRQAHHERHLRGFAAILQADAYSGYNAL